MEPSQSQIKSDHSTIPYYAPKESWPVPALPTLEEISQGKYMKDHSSAARVVRVGEHFIVKYGRCVHFLEGDNAIFVKKNTNIPVPTIYAMYYADLEIHGIMQKDCKVIVMEYIKGQTVDSGFRNLNEEEKERFAVQLRSHLSELRAIPSEGYFGTLGKGPLSNPSLMYFDSNLKAVLPGPFETEEELVEAMVVAFGNSRLTMYAHWIKLCMPHIRKAFQGHEPVFTHADLTRGNILIRDEDKSPVLIDWEYAAWLPSFWEFSILMRGSSVWDNWLTYVPKILDGDTGAIAWMHALRGCA